MLFTKPLFCSLADKYVIHEWILVAAIMGLTTSYGLLTLLPLSRSTVHPKFDKNLLLFLLPKHRN